MDLKNRWILSLPGILLFCNSYGAAEISDDDIRQSQQQIEQQQINRQLKQNLQQRQDAQTIINRVIDKNPKTLTKATSIPKESKKSVGVCFDIHHIDIEHNSLIDLSTQKILYRDYINQCLTIADINRLLKEITNYYILNGFITSRAGLKLGSNLKQGTLKIQAQEGSVNKILINFYPTKESNNNKKSAFPAIEGRLLNMKAIEQGLEQINKLSSQKAKMKVLPAKGKIASSNILVDIKKVGKPHYVSLSTNDYGPETTGENPLTLKLHFEDLNHGNDQLSISLKNDTKKSPHVDKNNVSKNTNFNFIAPGGWNTWTYSHNATSTIQQIKGRVQTFESSSRSTTDTIALTHDTFRNKQHKLSVGGTLALFNTESYVNDALVTVSSRKMTNFSLKLNYLKYLSGGHIDIGLTASEGLDDLGATRDGDIKQYTPKIQYRLDKLIANYSKVINTKVPINLLVTLTHQQARSELLSTQQCTVGGTGSVSGFDINKVSEENCSILNIKLSTHIFKWFGTTNRYLGSVVFGVNWDYGTAASYFQGEKHTLIGTGYFLSFNTQTVQFSYQYGKPANSPDIFKNLDKYPETDVSDAKIDLTVKYLF